MKKVYLPEYVKPKAVKFAEDYVEEVEGIEKGDKRYEKAFSKALQKFCLDYYESMTGIKTSNPTTEKAGKAFSEFANVLFDGPESFIGKRAKNNDEAAVLKQRLKGDIMHLAHIYLQAEGGMNVKRADRLLSKFEYHEKTGDKVSDAKDIAEVNSDRMKRVFVVLSILAAVESVFKMSNAKLQAFVNKEKALSPLEITEKLARAFRSAYSGIDLVSEANKAV